MQWPSAPVRCPQGRVPQGPDAGVRRRATDPGCRAEDAGYRERVVRTFGRLAAFLGVLLVATGCQSSGERVPEAFRGEGRQRLRLAVEAVRESEVALDVQIGELRRRLQGASEGDFGELVRKYESLLEIQDALGRATAVVRSRFRDLERIASELFAAWELEIRGRADPLEASGSRRQLNETRTRFHQFTSTVRMVESAADPVLSQLADPLPHLSRPWTPAVAAGVQSGLTALSGDADRWSEQVRESIARADAFLRSMPP